MIQTNQFDEILFSYFDTNSSSETEKAMLYALQTGGKRIRPLLLLTVLDSYQKNINIGYSTACAIEMIHTYSLIHDDLPAMDNDDYRRGKLTCHKQFNEAIAILAGDGLLTRAFQIVSDDTLLTSDQKVRVISYLSRYAGYKGMILGQEFDMISENQDVSVEFLKQIHHHKTGHLIAIPLITAAIIANKEEDIESLKLLGFTIGLAFQIQDDIFDVTKNLKNENLESSDLKNNKATYVSLLGLENAQETLKKTFALCYYLIDKLSLNKEQLIELVNKIENRTH